MQTQCPNCETRFRITDTQLKAADGKVRCSLCDEVFEAVTINEDSTDSETREDIELPEINSDLEQITESKSLATEDESTDNIIELDPDYKDYHSEEELFSDDDFAEMDEADNSLSEQQSDVETVQKEDDSNNIDGSSKPVDEDISEPHDDVYEIDLNDQDDSSDNDIIAEDNSNSNVSSSDSEGSQKQHLDLFQDSNNQDSPQIIPDEIRHDTASNDNNIGENLAWASGVLLFSGILLAQYFWFNRDQFTDSPEFQTLAQKVCQDFDCSKISIRDPANIELLTRNVFSHPDEKNALMINVALQNNAKFSQPYPVLQINFSDIRGEDVVARRFTSAEYLTGTEQKEEQLLQPGSSTNFNIEIEDPGKQAITYEFTFL